MLAPIFAAAEPRIIGSIVLSGGLLRQTLDPPAEPRNFLALARTPLLQIAGEHDFLFPLEEAQRPFFEAWGAPEQEKQLIQLPFGHAPRELRPVATEVRRWLSENLSSP